MAPSLIFPSEVEFNLLLTLSFVSYLWNKYLFRTTLRVLLECRENKRHGAITGKMWALGNQGKMGFQKGGVVRTDSVTKFQGVKAEGCSEALWEEGHWAFPQEHPVK